MKTLKQLGDNLCAAIETDDPAEIAEAVALWRKGAGKTRKKKDDSVQRELAKVFMAVMGKDRKLLTTETATAHWIGKILAGGITKADVLRAIEYLEKENPKQDYQLEVLSGRAMYEKWDRLWNKASKPMATRKVEFT